MIPSNNYPRILSDARGAIFVELVFTLPLFLLFVWFFIYVGVIYNAKSSLVSAVDNSLRSGLTRGYLSNTLDFRTLYDKLDDLCLYQTDLDIADTLFSPSNLSSSERAQLIGYYNDTTVHWEGWSDGEYSNKLCGQPLHNLYAIIFTELAMKKSIGTTIRFPCNPHDDSQPGGGSGCMRCIPLNPCTMDRSDVAPIVSPSSDAQACDADTINHRVALECEYRPASVFTKPIEAFIKALTGQETASDTTVSYKAFYDLPMDYDWNFAQ